MGISKFDTANVNEETSVYFDTKYSYSFSGINFTQFGSVEWTGSDSQFFWCANYRGSQPYDRLFFATNFNTNDPIRYYDSSWHDFSPSLDNNAKPVLLQQCKIIVPYYGRLLALNTYEGKSGDSPNNYFNRCRFSQIGSPIQSDAWQSNVFGKGGFIDAPVNQEIVSAIFYKNVLVVFFEQTTWQLRYVGEYGLPFIWERISSDFGSESTFSSILFDKGVFTVGDKAIIATDSNFCDRIDLDIPSFVFEFNNTNNGPARVIGMKDYFKELVYWCYSKSEQNSYFPDYLLVYNYRNNTWANFRTNCTFLGTQRVIGNLEITWDRDDIFWDDDTVFWDDVAHAENFPDIVLGNQNGYVLSMQDVGQDDISLKISDIVLTGTPIQITIVDNNLYVDEIVYIKNMVFLDASMTSEVSSDLNDKFYRIGSVSGDTITLQGWEPSANDFTNDFTFTTPTDSVYMGNGSLALIPRMSIVTKDFNPFESNGMQVKSSFVDFQVDASPDSVINVNIYKNTLIAQQGAMQVGNVSIITSTNQEGFIENISKTANAIVKSVNHGLLTGRKITIQNVLGMTDVNGQTYTITFIDVDNFYLNVDSTGFSDYISEGDWTTVDYNPFYNPTAEYSWKRFYANVFGQYLTYELTYNDYLMNQKITHNSGFTLNALTLYVKPAGRIVV